MRANIRLLNATHLREQVLRLKFSDGSWGDLDLGPMIRRGGPPLDALKDAVFFHRFTVDQGALAWPNGFELGAAALRRQLAEQKQLQPPRGQG